VCQVALETCEQGPLEWEVSHGIHALGHLLISYGVGPAELRQGRLVSETLASMLSHGLGAAAPRPCGEAWRMLIDALERLLVDRR